MLGPRRKYSCGDYPSAGSTLEDAETDAVAQTIAHAGLSDGQAILELGCGWGALSLRDAIVRALRGVYGKDTDLWMRRWRWFFLSTAGLFGFADGREWGISHFRLIPAR